MADILTITLSGPQGCGKTSVLNALPRLMEWIAQGRTPLPYTAHNLGNAEPPKTLAEVRAQVRVAELEAALLKAERWCRTRKGYPTLQSQLVASCAAEVGVIIEDPTDEEGEVWDA